jgi:mannose-6-phosphate isomerase-like protein (cupin superfamily)
MITRRDLAVAAVAMGATMAIVAFAQSTSKPVMRCSVFDWNRIKAEPTKTGARRAFFDSPTATLDRLECHVTTVNPGEAAHAPHKHPEEELMIVKEGTLESVQEGVTNVVGPGSIIFQASNQMHGVRNVGETSATYFVFKWFCPGTLKGQTE